MTGVCEAPTERMKRRCILLDFVDAPFCGLQENPVRDGIHETKKSECFGDVLHENKPRYVDKQKLPQVDEVREAWTIRRLGVPSDRPPIDRQKQSVPKL